MTKPLENRVALVTGASRGLGKAIALALAGAGARLAMVARDIQQLQTAAEEIRATGAEAEIFVADVSRESDIEQLAAQVKSRLGRVDILVNNAGINIRKPLVEFTADEWRQVLDTNLTGVFLMCRAFIPLMRGRGYGRILNLTSMMSHVALPGRTAYCASKAGLLGLTRALALELAPEGITVVGISPGPVATEMNAPLLNDPATYQQFTSNIPLGRWGKPEEIGRLALYLCSEEAAFITGVDIVIDGGWSAR
jgi:NAD(P)-dependent dehydrogenase (short-subunit alcohol dehydrogenase family)